MSTMCASESPRDTLRQSHARAVVHIDIDCFYAQCHMVADPTLRVRPLAVQQKHIVVTCNYPARERGIGKLSLITEAVAKCPDLVIVDGSDLTEYREHSARIFRLLRRFSPSVERLVFDEFFLDVTDAVRARMSSSDEQSARSWHGHVIVSAGESETPSPDAHCHLGDCCGCHECLMVASAIAAEARSALESELGFTSSAGVGVCKQHAKLAAGRHKPRDQSVLLPSRAGEIVGALRARDVPGVGWSMWQRLKTLQPPPRTAQDLRLLSLEELRAHASADTIADSVYAACRGIDNEPVVPWTSPKTLSVEDSFPRCDARADLARRLHELCGLLDERIHAEFRDSGRLPRVFRLTVRQRRDDEEHRGKGAYFVSRESRQCAMPHSLLPRALSEGTGDANRVDGLTRLSVSLFDRIVPPGARFHLNLLGVGVGNFTDPPVKGKGSLDAFVSHCDVSADRDEGTAAESAPGDVGGFVNGNDCDRARAESTQDTAVLCAPPGVDPDVFAELPREIQREIIAAQAGRLALGPTAATERKRAPSPDVGAAKAKRARGQQSIRDALARACAVPRVNGQCETESSYACDDCGETMPAWCREAHREFHAAGD